MYILGIWDGHDAGAAIIKGNKILVAINEERITRRKLYVGFPVNSIKACLDYLKIKPSDIQAVAVSTSDFAKTFTRYFPSSKENYYKFRRRMTEKPAFVHLRRNLKYKLTEINSSSLTKFLTKEWFKKQFSKIGFKDINLYLVEHHQAHAVSAAFCSGMKKMLTITIDGIGDGLSGTVNIFEDGKFERISSISGRDSLGIFFEQVTNLLGMRELEDEGKVMALSDFAYPIDEKKNKMLDFFKISGTNIKAKYSVSKQCSLLSRMLWNTQREQFAYMAQYTIEKKMLELFKNSINATGIKNVCWSGGVASNIKANMKIRLKSGLKNWFVFPHMGDGGLALGAAMQINFELNNISSYDFDNIYFGTDYKDDYIEKELKKYKMPYSIQDNISKEAGNLISRGEIVLWFQGRMEYGPRALGNRSIITLASEKELKDKLNIMVKKRDWFQPFCPTILKEDAKKFIGDANGFDKFMTMAYTTRKEARSKIEAVMNVDNSIRPQILGNENKKYRGVIEQVKRNTGDGIILNTSFNIHGYPIVMTPEDAIKSFKITKAKYLAIGNFLVKQG